MHPLAHRGGVDAEEARHLARVQLLEVAEHEGLAIEVRQPPECVPRLLRKEHLVQEVVGPPRRRRPTESLEEYLPQFDEHGRHAPEPVELQAAGRADDLLDEKLLAEQALSLIHI